MPFHISIEYEGSPLVCGVDLGLPGKSVCRERAIFVLTLAPSPLETEGQSFSCEGLEILRVALFF